MFLDFYGLREQPFGVTPDPKYLYASGGHREVLEALEHGIAGGMSFGALIAHPGVGKTTLLYALLAQYRKSARTAFVFNTQCNTSELIRSVAAELEAEVSDDPQIAHEILRRLLVDEANLGRHILVVVDEAQNLGEAVVEALRAFTDFQPPHSRFMHVIMAGQPQLADRLLVPQLSHLRQTVSVITQLRPLGAFEVGEYIQHRLKVAGHRGPSLFEPQAVEIIARESGGVPRCINRLCFNALSIGCALKARAITAEIMSEVREDLDIGALLKAWDPFAARKKRVLPEVDLSQPPAPPPPALPETPPPEPGPPPMEVIGGFVVTAPEAGASASATPIFVLPKHRSKGKTARVGFAELAAYGLALPLLLWLIAYLIVRFGMTNQ